MRNFIKKCSPALLAVVLGMPLVAQDNTGLDVQFRARFGYGLEAKDNLTNRVIGMGLELGYTTSVGRFAAELGYQYKPGNQYSYDIYSAPMEPGTVLYYWATGGAGGDRRRTQLQGATLRLTYEYEFSNNYLVRCGIQALGTKFRQEVIGTITYVDPDIVGSLTSANQIVTDSYAGPFEKTGGASISPFIGVGYRFGSSTFELNLLGLSYTAIDYVHVAGTGRPYNPPTSYNPGFNNSKDYFKESNRMVPHLEISYAFRF